MKEEMMTKNMKPKADYLFEASWEVCNKVGGIYTVVKSKTPVIKEFYENYFLIGPYFESKAKLELELAKPPEFLIHVFEKLQREHGLVCHYGKWEIEDFPNTILIEFSSLLEKKNDIKTALWNLEKIDSLKAGWDFEEPMLWSWAVGILLTAIETELSNKKIVAQFHEWLSGFSIFYLKQNKSKIGTVFTTHATMLGRSIAGSGMDLYGLLDQLNPEEQAYKLNVESKFHTERAAALKSDVFTTVSEITAIEAEKILGRKPDVILNNGLSLKNFPTIEEMSMKHFMTRDRIREFLTLYFFPYYTFDLDHNLIFFIVGRYEFKNKGLDILIKALGRLNDQLKEEKSERTISVFFWIPMETHGIKMEVLENKNYYQHIKNYVRYHSEDILKRLVNDIVSSKTPSMDSMFTAQFLKHIEADTLAFKRQGTPSLVTHNIPSEHRDLIITNFKHSGLFNREEDKVKVIAYPVYLDGNDGLINLTYYDALAGTHLGIFPSYYEPWGYTPQETAALGVPSVTTDLAGFGRFISKKIADSTDKRNGIYVLERQNKSEDEIIANLQKIMYDFAELERDDRVKSKINAKTLVENADWKDFVINYITAHNKSLK